jgi:CheY-like chemotaxis protein/MinD-like ATPase involved in chromosome partitioning or flagellar assembly
MSARILIVDDEPNLLRMMEYALESQGYQISTALDGHAAFQSIYANPPDLIILDVMLPDMSGEDLCRQLRKNKITSAVPIIMLSAKSQPRDKILGLRAGADDYLTKPIQTGELIARVQAMLALADRLRAVNCDNGAKVIGFIGAKGGAGTTTMALNTAWALAEMDQSTIAIEMRTSYGTFSSGMNITPSANLWHVIGNGAPHLEKKQLHQALIQVSAGLRVLFGPQKPDGCLPIDPDRAGELVEEVAKLAQYVVVDLPPFPCALSQAVLEHCDLICIVVEPETTSVASGMVLREILNNWGFVGERVGAIVVNRATMSVSRREIAARMGCDLLGVIPPALELCINAVQAGVPFVVHSPEHVASVNMMDLTKKLVSQVNGGG